MMYFRKYLLPGLLGTFLLIVLVLLIQVFDWPYGQIATMVALIIAAVYELMKRISGPRPTNPVLNRLFVFFFETPLGKRTKPGLAQPQSRPDFCITLDALDVPLELLVQHVETWSSRKPATVY